MKKVIIIAVLAFNAVCMSYLAFSENEQPFTIKSAIAELDCSYIENTYDCEKVLSGSGQVQSGSFISGLKLPVDWDFDADGDLTVTYTDVKVTCSANGESTCSPYSCAEFWLDLAEAED